METKSMRAMPNTRARSPRWYLIPARALLLTFVCTLLAFAVALLVGLVAIAIRSHIYGVRPVFPIAYRNIALPVAMVTGMIVLVLSLVMEIRHYRQSRALAAIARAN